MNHSPLHTEHSVYIDLSPRTAKAKQAAQNRAEQAPPPHRSEIRQRRRQKEMNKEISYFKKVLVILMAVMMVFTMMPGMAWADEANNETATGSEADNIVASGIDGNIAWSLDSEGTLTISKANTEADNDGSMNNYKIIPTKRAPWLQNGNNLKIKKLSCKKVLQQLDNMLF